MTVDRKHCYDAARELGEKNDCTVRACAVATGIDYFGMHEYLGEYGRKNGKGLASWEYHRALTHLGYKLTKLEGPKYEYTASYVAGHNRYYRKTGTWAWVDSRYRHTRKKVGKGKDYNAATMVTLARELTEGTYLVSTDGHVACLKNGEVHDWTKGRRHRIEAVYKVEEATDA